MREQLWNLTSSARWFGGRGRGAQLRGIAELPSSGGVRSFLVEALYADGGTETYHVPAVEDALPELVEAVDEGLVLWEAFGSGAEGFELLGEPVPARSARRFAGEQSNTNVFFDNGTLLKVLRRVEEGADIEAELLHALRGSGAAPELHGRWSSGDLSLGLLVEALPEPEDGFDLAKEAASRRTSFEAHAEALGVALARVHELLARELPTEALDVDRFASEAMERYERAAATVGELAPFRDAIAHCFSSLSTVDGTAQRVHGDCHLGQTLLSRGRWRYVDFEGEPMKSAAERRAPDSPLRDVAGMLRSFDYAAATGGGDPTWLASARSAFARGYGAEQADPLLAAYELDKAIYEAVYEARFRPELLHVPLAGIRGLLESVGE